MINNILIGNFISCIAAIFTALSSLSSGKRRIYGFQAMQCLTMAIASIFFCSWTGVTTFLLCALRNYLLAADRYSKKRYFFFLAAVAGMGLAFNNRGWLGLLPVITTVIYTIGQYHLKSDMTIKANIALNLILWSIYDLLIRDYVSAAMDSLTTIITIGAMLIALFHLSRSK